MRKHAGLVIGVLYLIIAMGAFKSGMAGWEGGHDDLGFWWTVIACLLTLAGVGALLGTWIHAWARPDAHSHPH
jgi:hypothetical protein